MKKIRIGNDFVFNWGIERGGLPEDLSSVLEKHLHLAVFDKRVELIEGVDYDITGNVVRIEVTPTIANILGTYKAEFHYILPDNGLIDEDRKCAVDVDAFQIVARTAQADDPSEFTVTSDMAIAFKGDKGDSAYQVWLDAGNTGAEEDYFAYLRQPAIDAAQSANEAADSALTATQEATTAASLADTARLAIQDDLALKANQTDLAQLESEVEQNSYVKITNLVTNGNFSNGLNDWVLGGQGTASVSNNLATITGTGTGSVYLKQNTEHEASPNDKIYFKAKRKSNGGILFFRFENSTSSEVTVINISSPLGEYSYDSIIATLSETFVEGGLRFAYNHYLSPSTSNLGTSSEVGNIVVVNLTKTFGAGNEPTEEEMDLLISILGIDYFEGEITIPAQKIMQWQLSMIRQNRNAIIALGGTII